MDVSENSGFPPQIIHFNRFSIIFTIHFGVFPYFLETTKLTLLTTKEDLFVDGFHLPCGHDAALAGINSPEKRINGPLKMMDFPHRNLFFSRSFFFSGANVTFPGVYSFFVLKTFGCFSDVVRNPWWALFL